MTPETLAAIKKNIAESEKALTTMREDISKAKKAGIDVAEQEKTYLDLNKKLTQLKSVYS
jgi:predicted  nucleic acid-binding Zn-ribbon protein